MNGNNDQKSKKLLNCIREVNIDGKMSLMSL